MKTNIAIVLLSIMLITACKKELRPISFGKDNCEQCRMTVMDPRFAAAILTSKGKTLPFDAEECMLRYIKSKGIAEDDHCFVSDYTLPGTLIPADEAVFLHGDSIDSPMGGNLAAFSKKSPADSVQKRLGGRMLLWQELVRKP